MAFISAKEAKLAVEQNKQKAREALRLKIQNMIETAIAQERTQISLDPEVELDTELKNELESLGYLVSTGYGTTISWYHVDTKEAPCK